MQYFKESYDPSGWSVFPKKDSAARFGRIFCAFAEYAVSAEDWEKRSVKDAVEEMERRLGDGEGEQPFPSKK